MYTNEIARTKKRKKTLIILSLVFVAGVFAGLALDRVAFCSDTEKTAKSEAGSAKQRKPLNSNRRTSNNSKTQKKASQQPEKTKEQNGSSSQTVQAKSYRCPEKEKKWILIDKGKHKLYVMNGKNSKPITTYGVATGKNPENKAKPGDLRTPEGDDFYVQSVQDASTWSHDFHDGKGVIKKAYGPWFIRLHPGWNGIGIHGTHDPKSIGKDATEGCIRLKNKDVEELKKKHIKSGMKVVIVRNGKITPPAKSTTQDSGPRESNKERTEDKKKKGSYNS